MSRAKPLVFCRHLEGGEAVIVMHAAHVRHRLHLFYVSVRIRLCIIKH